MLHTRELLGQNGIEAVKVFEHSIRSEAPCRFSVARLAGECSSYCGAA
jgi:hypothetical protein